MKNFLLFATITFAALTPRIQAQESKSPVADATRAFLEREGKNLIAAAEEMPADKYEYHPTPEQMTFAHLVFHIAHSNRMLCSGIAGEAAPKDTATDNDAKEKLVANMKESFDYCTNALAKVDDSKLGEEVPPFHRTRANSMMALAADLADHYSMAASYLRLNGLLPPTAQRKK
ncbi:MAG TPA: DinB family protein [Thermoanaerobaculia bacterium]|nr:DinB family protein [Thermoanaerobaculia bacterium]